MIFPNVVYVLSYARQILVKNLAKAFSLSEEDRYIDKIVQVTFRVPQPESFTLRRLFRSGIEELFPGYIANATTGSDISSGERIKQAIDEQGGTSLKTPRDVTRVLNSLRLYASTSLDDIDLGDMIWLQLIRLRNENLYSWVENYMTLVGSIVNENASMGANGKAQLASNLVQMISEEEKSDDIDRVLYRFGSTIPGIKKAGNATTRDWACLQNIDLVNLGSFIDAKRLGSPSHYRYYFALSKPKRAFNEESMHEFFELLQTDVEGAIEFVLDLCGQKSDTVFSKAHLFFERLEGASLKALTAESQANLMLVLANTLDEAAREGTRGEWGRMDVLETGRRIFYTLLENSEGVSNETLENMFGNGEAIGWLSNIVRRETFAQGRFGEQRKPEELWNFTQEEMDTIILNYVNNVRARAVIDVTNSPNFASILYAWAQAVPENYTPVQNWLAIPLEDNETFLNVLIGLRGWTNSSNRGVYYPLKRQNVEEFFDYDEAYERTLTLQQSEDNDLTQKIELVMTAFKDAQDD